MRAGDFTGELAAQGLSTDNTLTVEEGLPLIQVETVGSSEEQATETVNAVLLGIAAELDARQDAVPAAPQDRLGSEVVDTADTASAVTLARVSVVATVVLGMGVAVAVALLVENVAGGSRQRRLHEARRAGRRRAARGRRGCPAALGGSRHGEWPCIVRRAGTRRRLGRRDRISDRQAVSGDNRCAVDALGLV